MPDVKWIKITTDMFQDEKIRIIRSMPDADALIVIWVQLICQAGITNDNGHIYLNENIPYTDETLATIFDRPVNTIRLALKTFESLGMVHRNGNNTIYLNNFEKYQNLAGLDHIREQTRLRVARYREKQKQLSMPVTLPVTRCNETDIDIEEEKNKKREDIDNNTYSSFYSELNFKIPITKITGNSRLTNGILYIFDQRLEKSLRIATGKLDSTKINVTLHQTELKRLGIDWEAKVSDNKGNTNIQTDTYH